MFDRITLFAGAVFLVSLFAPWVCGNGFECYPGVLTVLFWSYALLLAGDMAERALGLVLAWPMAFWILVGWWHLAGRFPLPFWAVITLAAISAVVVSLTFWLAHGGANAIPFTTVMYLETSIPLVVMGLKLASLPHEHKRSGATR